jgi:methylmalonyl-CoA mutase, N-terminal domain
MTKKKITSEEQNWRETTLREALEQGGLRRERFTTTSDLSVPDVTLPPEEDEAERYLEKLGFPGRYPFTRGVYPTMYRGRLWTMRQYAGFGSAQQTNERFRFLLEKGQTGLSTAFDLPTQIGYDSDAGLSLGEVGKVGVAIDSVRDMATLFEQIPLDRVTTSMTINATAATLLAMYIVVGERQGVAQEKLGGTVQNDLLKEYIARGTYIYPPKPSMRLAGDIIAYCTEHLPRFNPISISGYHIREAGSTAAQEIAFTLSNAVAYVEEVLRRGLDVDRFAGRLSFFFNAHNNFFEEIAKFRAARRMWARIMKKRFGASDPKSWMLRFHTQTAGSTLTAKAPNNNVVRVTLQALAAVLGGTQSLHTNSRDEALGLPTEDSAALALATQQIIAHESGVADTPDPLGGSYYVESLTDRLEEAAQALMAEIERLGGAVEAVESGYQQRAIGEAAYTYQQAVDAGEAVVVGVNRYQQAAEQPQEILQVDEAVEAAQREALEKLRANRDNEQVSQVLETIRKTARGEDNLMPPIIAAVRAEATLGEIADALREVFGEAPHRI